MRTSRHVGFVLALGMLLGWAPVARAQDQAEAPEWVKRLAIDPDSQAARQYASHQKSRATAEKQLRKIRFQHFGQMKNQQVRQAGLVKLREYADPAIFPSLVRVFEREAADVKAALIDQFSEAACPEGDAAIAWIGVFDADPEVRAMASKHLERRIAAVGSTPATVKLVVFEGLRSSDQGAVAAAARFASGMKILEAIPWLIAGQVSGGPQITGTGFGGSRDGALAWIMVGTQTAFVSDLQPVVGEAAVAFDPQLSVVNEGVILRVIDAAVVTYNVDIHNALVDLTTDAWGQSTKQLGWNVPAWKRWYRESFLPHLAALQNQLASAGASAPPK